MKKVLALCFSLLMACANQNDFIVADDPELMAQHFMNAFFQGEDNLDDYVIADVAFLDYNAPNSAEGQKRIHDSLQKMGSFLRKNIQEAGIDSQHLIFKPAGKSLHHDGQLANVTLHVFEPNETEEVKAMELITRWRKTDEGWKLDLNPYLDNFRELKKK